MSLTNNNVILELKGITKLFPGVRALDEVSFTLKRGEIHALMGENGAGKSTFIKTITGVHQPDEGEIFYEGKKIIIHNTKEAAKLGIAAIYQHSTSYPDLTVTENIFLGHEILGKANNIQWNKMNIKAKELLDSLGAGFLPTEIMGELSVAQQQIVEIAKALSTNAKIIIMDEPTAALTKSESEELYNLAEKLRDDGASIIFITHRMEDMYRLASRVTVLRDAKYIGSWNLIDITEHDLIVAMVGREITELFPKRSIHPKQELLRVEELSQIGYFKDISFCVRSGEILALTGIVGAGRSEVCQAICGITKLTSGKIFVENKEVHLTSPKQAEKLGIGYLPEDRQKQGLILDWSIARNVTLSNLEKYIDKLFINETKENDDAKMLSEKLQVKAPTVFDTASSLSGGNQQKIVVAKMLNASLKLIIMDEPTKGVDVGAKAAIYNIMGDLAEDGYGIILISSEMPEVLGMADNIIVLKDGRISAKMTVEEATQEKILAAAIMAKEAI